VAARKNSRTDAVRAAATQAIEATAGQAAASTQRRAQRLAGDLSQAAGRVRDTLDDLRPPTGDNLRLLHERVAKLEARIAKLEGTGRAAPAKRRAPAKRKPKS
jgi:signal transduction histidine kinase